MQLFVDMDGVLADFDAHYRAVFNRKADKVLDNVDWAAVRKVNGFYLNMPPMPDFNLLWTFISRYDPIVLTGIPMAVPEAQDNKRAWVRKHIGSDVEVRCCRSKDKYVHAIPGDILIDDWEKYKDLWIGAGGAWITHTDAKSTIKRLAEITERFGLS